MSLESMIWALHLKPENLNGVHDGAHLTLVLLANYMSPEGRGAWPAVSTMAERRGVSNRTISRHLDQLEEAGLITRGDQSAVRNLPANRRPVVWDLGRFRGDTGVIPRHDTDVIPDPSRGDTRDAFDMTPGVIQTVIRTSSNSKYLTQEAPELSTGEHPNRDCIHGAPAEHYHDKRAGKSLPRCPLCRKAGVLTLAPKEGDDA